MIQRRPVVFVVFLLALFGVGLFSWNVFSYYQRITNGTLQAKDIPDVSFANQLTSSRVSRTAAQTSVGGVNVDVDTDDDPSFGPTDAPLTIVEFVDYECPHSQGASSTFRRLSALYGNRVRFVIRDFPLTDIHPNAALAAEAANCAYASGVFWDYHDKLFQHQEDQSLEALVTYAEEVGLSGPAFRACVTSGSQQKEVAEDVADGQAAGVYGTPTFFLNGHRIDGAIPQNMLEQIIQSFLSRQP